MTPTSDDVLPGDVVDEPYVNEPVEWLSEREAEEIFGKYRAFPIELQQYPKTIQYTKKSVLIVLELFANHLLEDENKRCTFNVDHFDVINACTVAAYEKVNNSALSALEVCNVVAFLNRYHVCIKAQLNQLKRFYVKYSAVDAHRDNDNRSEFFKSC